MPALVIFGVKKVLDADALAEYRIVAHKTIAESGGRLVVGFKGFTPLEGEDLIAMVVVEFPTREAAQAWYHGAPYQAASELRRKGSDCVVSLVSW